MIFDNFLIHSLKSNLLYSAQRQNVLAENVANVNTPNYKVKDLYNYMVEINLKTTNNSHIQNSPFRNFAIYYSKDQPIKFNGNNVNLVDQALKISNNNIEYNKVISLYKKVLNIFSLVNSYGNK